MEWFALSEEKIILIGGKRMKNRHADAWDLSIEMPVDPHDPIGSYTGRPTEKWEMPVQDADDL